MRVLILSVLILCVQGCIGFAAAIDMNIIARIESSNRADAYNQDSGAIGMYQIRPIVLKEYNKFNKLGYKTADLYDAAFNRDVADWYMNTRIPQMLKSYKIKDTVRNRLIAYNFGIGNLSNGRPLPKETQDYIVKYEDQRNREEYAALFVTSRPAVKVSIR